MKHILPINEYLKNRLTAKYILNQIKDDISKKYPIEKSFIQNDRLYIFIEAPYNKKFVNDKKFRNSILDKYNSDKSLLCDTDISYGEGTVIYTIKDLFFERVVVPKYLYHVCDKSKIESIMRNGLLPMKNIGDYGACSYDKPFIFATINPKSLFHRWVIFLFKNIYKNINLCRKKYIFLCLYILYYDTCRATYSYG